MIFIPVILFLAVLAWDILSDYKKWLKNSSVEHTKEAWLRMLLLSPSIIGFTIFHPVKHWGILVLSIFMVLSIFWYLFDGFYNKIRGFDWWFSGSIDEDESKFDNFLRWLGGFWGKVIKIGGIIIFTVLYILLWVLAE
jgi:hypothetical protein